MRKRNLSFNKQRQRGQTNRQTRESAGKLTTEFTNKWKLKENKSRREIRRL